MTTPLRSRSAAVRRQRSSRNLQHARSESDDDRPDTPTATQFGAERSDVRYYRARVDSSPITVATPPDLVNGGAAALRQVYDLHGATVYRFCRQTLPLHLAEEATQDVFVQVWRNRHRFDPERGSIIAWLIGIAKLRVIDLARSEQRHNNRRADANTTQASQADDQADDQIDQLATKAVVADALRKLPARQRDFVTMAFVDGLTHQEIADRTGTALGTVKSDIRRGLLAIRAQMEVVDD